MIKKILIFITVLFFPCSFSEKIKIEKIVDPVTHGEGPHWDAEKQVLFFVDISSQKVYKYNPETQSVNYVFVDGGPVSLVIPNKLNESQLIISRGLDIATITWNGKSSKPSSIKTYATVDQEKPENRFNDGKADARGRLWAGTMGPEKPDLLLHQGSLYSFDWTESFKPIKHVSPVSVSNGIAWNDNDDIMYYVDSPTKVIYAFDYDIITGTLSNQRNIFDLEKNNITGVPDGMTIDKNGNLWIAVYQGSCVIQVDPKEEKLLKKIDFPVTQVTSCTFGGKNLEDLYVTSSKVGKKDKDLKKEPLAGALFKVTGLDVQGQHKSNTVTLV